MKEVFVIAFPDGTFMDKEGKYTTFFFAKLWDSENEAFEFACDKIDCGICFKIDRYQVQYIG